MLFIPSSWSTVRSGFRRSNKANGLIFFRNLSFPLVNLLSVDPMLAAVEARATAIDDRNELLADEVLLTTSSVAGTSRTVALWAARGF
jgi:hypothetical protein